MTTLKGGSRNRKSNLQEQMVQPLIRFMTNDIIQFTHTSNAYAGDANNVGVAVSATPSATSTKFLVYSYFDNKPNLSVYDGAKSVSAAPADVDGTNPLGHSVMYSTTENTLRIYFDGLNSTAGTPFAANGKNVKWEF